MRIPILQAEVANLFILWQIDIGFYEDLPSVQQHIVKVWDIVDHEDVRINMPFLYMCAFTTNSVPILASKHY